MFFFRTFLGDFNQTANAIEHIFGSVRGWEISSGLSEVHLLVSRGKLNKSEQVSML